MRALAEIVTYIMSVLVRLRKVQVKSIFQPSQGFTKMLYPELNQVLEFKEMPL